MKLNPALYHFALILYCLIIFILSSLPGETFPKVDFEFSDKIVHVIIYAALCILFFYSLKNQTKYVKLQKHSLEYSVLFTAIYGMTDEIHQYFVTNRSCEFYDWIADVTGALIVYFVFKYLRNKKLNIALLLLILMSGCSGTENKGISNLNNFNLTVRDVWINQMPSTNGKSTELGFTLIIAGNTTDPADDFSVANFKIILDNDTLSNKKFVLETEKVSEGIININISQKLYENYINKNKELPTEAAFEFNILQSNKKIKTIKTSKLIINKVY